MAENIQEIKPPEPPPKPPEVPKPTEQSNPSESLAQPKESQQSAQQETREAAQSEHEKATNGMEPDGLRPTPEFQARLDEQTGAKNEPDGLQPTPEVQERLDAHTAAKVEHDPAAPQESDTTQRSQDPATTPGDDGDRNTPPPAGEQAEEHAAVREAAAVEHTKAAEETKAAEDTTMPGEANTSQSNPLPEADPAPLDNDQDASPLVQPPDVLPPAHADPITSTPPDQSPGAGEPTGQSPETVDENTPDPPAVEQIDQNATDGHGSEAAAAQSGDQDTEPQATNEQGSAEETPVGNEPADDPAGPKDATSSDDAKTPADIADEIASCPVDISTRPHVNSAGDTVDRNIVNDAEDLLPVAEHFGLDELSHDKDDYYSGQLPDGRYRKIEWNMDGHPNTNEGPHVKVMETEDPFSAPARGNRWKTKAMIFVDGHEEYRKQWH